MSLVGAREGYGLWAATYDSWPNPLLALEQRVAAPLLGPLKGSRVIDICAGTGRWMAIAARLRASIIGLDLSPEMMGRAAEKPGLAGRLAIGDIAHLPFANTSADIAICSFGMSYVRSMQQAFREMARVSKRVMISDMHPAALDPAGLGPSRQHAGNTGSRTIVTLLRISTRLLMLRACVRNAVSRLPLANLNAGFSIGQERGWL